MPLDKNQILALSKGIRCIAHLDLDAFYTQVEHLRLDIPLYVPLAVQQWQGLIAVNYAARAAGIKRHMNVQEARRLCPEIRFVHVATYVNGEKDPQYHIDPSPRTHKVSLEPYRRTSAQIFSVIRQHCPSYERASIDEAYLDLTSLVIDRILATPPENGSPHMVWDTESLGPLFNMDQQAVGNPSLWSDYMLLHAAQITSDIRNAVFDQLRLTCSAGISHNKTIAKLCSSMHKPNKQTTVRQSTMLDFLGPLPFSKIRSLGGKLGQALEAQLDVKTCAELREYSIDELSAMLEPALAKWLFGICRGVCDRPVQVQCKAKSMMATKSLRPSVTDIETVKHWVTVLACEIYTRVKDDFDLYNRWPKNLVVNVKVSDCNTKVKTSPFPSRPSIGDSSDALESIAMVAIQSLIPTGASIEFVALRCLNFEDLAPLCTVFDGWIRSPVLREQDIVHQPQNDQQMTNDVPERYSFFEQRARQIALQNANTDSTPIPLLPQIAEPSASHIPPPPSAMVQPARPPICDVLERDRKFRLTKSEPLGARPKLATPAALATGGFALLAADQRKRKAMNRSKGPSPHPATKRQVTLTDALFSKPAAERKVYVLSDSDDQDAESSSMLVKCSVCGDAYPSLLIRDHELYHAQDQILVKNAAISPSNSSVTDCQIDVDGTDSDFGEDVQGARDDLVERRCGEGVSICPKCGEEYPTIVMTEHLDYHLALELSKE